jgi:phosphate-selective porin OprO and OprP
MRLKSVISTLILIVFPLISLADTADFEARLERLEALSTLEADGLRPVIGGLLQFDSAIYGSDSRLEKSKRSLLLENGTHLRRVRLQAEGRLGQALRYKTQWQSDGSDISILSAYLQFDTRLGSFRLGNNKIPQSQDQMRSSSDLSFLERSMISDVMDLGRALGLTTFHQLHPKLYLMTGIYSGTIDSRDADEKSLTAVGARAAAEIYKGNDSGFYFSTYYNRVSNADEPRFRTDLQSRVSRERILDTKKINDVSKYYHTGIELTGMFNRARLVSQLSTLRLKDRQSFMVDNNTAGKKMEGYVVEAGWMLTEDRRRFDEKSATFENIRPNRSFMENGWGAFELVGRLSSIDLNDGEGANKISGGEGQVLSLALNWVPVAGALLITEIAQADVKILKNNIVEKERLRYLQLRVQASF